MTDCGQCLVVSILLEDYNFSSDASYHFDANNMQVQEVRLNNQVMQIHFKTSFECIIHNATSRT